jgi:uncharacterized membrane protein YjjP (DUF1212 family)
MAFMFLLLSLLLFFHGFILYAYDQDFYPSMIVSVLLFIPGFLLLVESIGRLS